jgi:phospholipid/cholesterol/gamma-HCH transport system substrate-binding protein
MDGGKVWCIMSMSREHKVGLFIICTAVIILLALLYLAREKGFFATIHTFTISSKTGEGFTEGMPVVFSGFNIGKVQALELNDKGIVLIKIKIPAKHVKWVRADSAFILYRPLIGVARINVTTDNLDSPPLPEDKIPEVAIVNDINVTIGKIQPLLETLERLSRKVDSMASKTDEQVFGKDGTLPQINIILKDVAGKLEKLNTTIDNLNKISKETSEGMKDLGVLREDIDDAVEKLDDVARDIDAIISRKRESEIKVP